MNIHSILEKKHVLSSVIFSAMASAFLLVAPGQAFAASLIQEAPLLYSGSGNCVAPSTATFSYPSNVTAGDLLVVTLAYKGSSNLIANTVPTDSQGNTYTAVSSTTSLVNAGSNSSRSIGSFVATAGSSGANTVTVPCGANESNTNMVPLVFLHEYVGNGIFGAGTQANNGTTGNSAYGFGTPFGAIWQDDVMIVNNQSIPTFNTTYFTPSSWVTASLKGSIGGQSRVQDPSDNVTYRNAAITFTSTAQSLQDTFQIY